MKKIITWVDLQGNYRVTSPAYDWLAKAHGFTEDDAINWNWTKLVVDGDYGITEDHPLFLVEDFDQRARLVECCGTYFRYGAFTQAGVDGAWEMDIDGRPRINMVKASVIQMDFIRIARNTELKVLDELQSRAQGTFDLTEVTRLELKKNTLRNLPETFDLSSFTTPQALKEAWPGELPVRRYLI